MTCEYGKTERVRKRPKPEQQKNFQQTLDVNFIHVNYIVRNMRFKNIFIAFKMMFIYWEREKFFSNSAVHEL